MIVLKVVGFLPDVENSLVLCPDDINNQMGSDFDIDKLTIMYRNFYRNTDNKFHIPKYGSEETEFKSLMEERELLLMEQYTNEAVFNNKEAKKLTNDYFDIFAISEGSENIIDSRLSQVQRRLNILGKEEDGKFIFDSSKTSRISRENELIDIFESVLTHPNHTAEIMSPVMSDDIDAVAQLVKDITKSDNKNINPLTEEGQRIFRSRNIAGKDLTAIAANFNSFLNIAQETKMNLSEGLAMKFAYNLKEVNEDYVRKKMLILKVKKDML